MSGFFKTLTNKIKNFFGIASPSKLMADMFGFLPEGMAKGILDSADIVKDTIDKINSLVADTLDTDFGAKVQYATAPAVVGGAALGGAGYAGNQTFGARPKGDVTIHQYIQSVPQTPCELAQQSVAAWRRERWTL